MKRYQYTAIDDATRIRALKIYDHHNQSNPIDFTNAIIDKFPFRIREVRTVNGFQEYFTGMLKIWAFAVPISKPASPQLNGKVEFRIELMSKNSTSALPTSTSRPSNKALRMGAVL